MTANELADKLHEIYTGTDYEEIKQAATMLRQQQAEIEALKLRELTDEEIIQINKDEGTCWDVPDRFAISIARAILRKAQEK
jgi:hypothetical protein